jgi:hypothetical protein
VSRFLTSQRVDAISAAHVRAGQSCHQLSDYPRLAGATRFVGANPVADPSVTGLDTCQSEARGGRQTRRLATASVPASGLHSTTSIQKYHSRLWPIACLSRKRNGDGSPRDHAGVPEARIHRYGEPTSTSWVDGMGLTSVGLCVWLPSQQLEQSLYHRRQDLPIVLHVRRQVQLLT